MPKCIPLSVVQLDSPPVDENVRQPGCWHRGKELFAAVKRFNWYMDNNLEWDAVLALITLFGMPLTIRNGAMLFILKINDCVCVDIWLHSPIRMFVYGDLNKHMDIRIAFIKRLTKKLKNVKPVNLQLYVDTSSSYFVADKSEAFAAGLYRDEPTIL